MKEIKIKQKASRKVQMKRMPRESLRRGKHARLKWRTTKVCNRWFHQKCLEMYILVKKVDCERAKVGWERNFEQYWKLEEQFKKLWLVEGVIIGSFFSGFESKTWRSYLYELQIHIYPYGVQCWKILETKNN